MEGAATRWENELFTAGDGGTPRSDNPAFVEAVVAALIDRSASALNLTQVRLLHESGAFCRKTAVVGLGVYVPITPTVERMLWSLCSRADDQLAREIARCSFCFCSCCVGNMLTHVAQVSQLGFGGRRKGTCLGTPVQIVGFETPSGPRGSDCACLCSIRIY